MHIEIHPPSLEPPSPDYLSRYFDDAPEFSSPGDDEPSRGLSPPSPHYPCHYFSGGVPDFSSWKEEEFFSSEEAAAKWQEAADREKEAAVGGEESATLRLKSPRQGFIFEYYKYLT